MLMREMFVTGRDVLWTREREPPRCTRIHRKEDKAEQILEMMYVITELEANLRLIKSLFHANSINSGSIPK